MNEGSPIYKLVLPKNERQGERCSCGRPATHKVEEVLPEGEIRHPLSRYLCDYCFADLMGPVAREWLFGDGRKFDETLLISERDDELVYAVEKVQRKAKELGKVLYLYSDGALLHVTDERPRAPLARVYPGGRTEVWRKSLDA